MAEIIGWFVISAFVLSALGVIDVTVEIGPHVKGEKVICIRGKSLPVEANGS